jgi:hypothetical protein
MPLKTLRNGSSLLFAISINSILVEVLTVCMSSLKTRGTNFRHRSPQTAPTHPSSDEETFNSFWISFGLSVIILASLAVFSTIVAARRRHPFLSQLPGTLASSLILINQSKLLYDLVGTERFTMEEMDRRLISIGKTFGFRWFVGRDGKTHLGVDEEPLISSHSGINPMTDPRLANEPWSTDWTKY